MSTFDASHVYQPKGDGAFFDDGREIQLLHYIYNSPNLRDLRNNPSAILDCIDKYAHVSKYLMNVGHQKGAIVADIIRREKPQTMIELGGYVGYSALCFAGALKSAHDTPAMPKPKYYSLERNPEFAAVIGSLVDLAGLRDMVEICVGPSDASIRRLHNEGKLKGGIDLMFLDHYKPAYTTDLKLCEELGLIKPGRTVLAADNVVSPGNPPYLKYVRSSAAEKRQALESANGDRAYGEFEQRTVKQYEQREGVPDLDQSLKGNPNLVYDSQLVDSFEPTGVNDGVEVTRCVGEE